MLFCMWAVVAPALVEERTGVFGAFGRRRELTKGARWKVFGLELILLVAMWIVTLVFGLLILRTNNAEALAQNAVGPDERRVGKECVSTCRSRWWRSHKQKKN